MPHTSKVLTLSLSLDSLKLGLEIQSISHLVEEESQLILYEGSKSGLAGFYDPCEESDKHLLIQYLYRGQIHQAQITDREQLHCPKMAYQLET